MALFTSPTPHSQHLYTHMHTHTCEERERVKNEEERVKKVRVRKIRGEGRREVSTPKPQNPLILSYFVGSYPIH